MSHTCEFATGAEANEYGHPVMIYCGAPAVNFKDKWLCPEHYKQATKSKGGYIYRQGVQPQVADAKPKSKKFIFNPKPVKIKKP